MFVACSNQSKCLSEYIKQFVQRMQALPVSTFVVSRFYRSLSNWTLIKEE